MPQHQGRPRVTGGGRKQPKHSRTGFSNRHKLEVVRFFGSCNDMTQTLSKFYPSLSDDAKEQRRKLIYQWRKNASVLEERCKSAAVADMKYVREQGVATILSTEAEDTIVQWVNQLRKDGVPVSAAMLRLKGMEVAQDLEIAGFRGSWHWQKRFLRRHRLSFRSRTRQGQITPDTANDTAVRFGVEVLQKMLQLHVHKVFYADQTGVFFEYLPTRTLNSRGSKTVWVRHGGKDKERVTAMLLGDSEGGKYPPFLVLKSNRSTVVGGDLENWEKRRGFGIHVWKEAKKIMQASDVELYANPTAWWNELIHLQWLETMFGSRPRPRHPVILLVDDFSGHWTPAIQTYAESIDLHVMRVPPSCTATCQPADIAWNRPFKSYLRSEWFEMLRAQLRQHTGSTQAFKFKPPTRTTLCEWVSSSWGKLTENTIKNGFRRAHILAPLPAREVESVNAQLPQESIVGEHELRLIEDSVCDVLSDDEVNFSDTDSNSD